MSDVANYRAQEVTLYNSYPGATSSCQAPLVTAPIGLFIIALAFKFGPWLYYSQIQLMISCGLGWLITKNKRFKLSTHRLTLVILQRIIVFDQEIDMGDHRIDGIWHTFRQPSVIWTSFWHHGFHELCGLCAKKEWKQGWNRWNSVFSVAMESKSKKTGRKSKWTHVLWVTTLLANVLETFPHVRTLIQALRHWQPTYLQLDAERTMLAQPSFSLNRIRWLVLSGATKLPKAGAGLSVGALSFIWRPHLTFANRVATPSVNRFYVGKSDATRRLRI